MSRIMIAVDGSDTDQQIADTAHRLFGDGAEYWAINVQADPSVGQTASTWPAVYGGTLVGYGMSYPYMQADPYRAGERASDPPIDRAELVARQAAAELDHAEIVAERGDPPTAIRAAVVEHDVDVVVVGASTRSWWSTLFSPSVADAVVDDSPVPVLVVPVG